MQNLRRATKPGAGHYFGRSSLTSYKNVINIKGELESFEMLTEQRLSKLISETKMVGEFYLTAVIHPANYPELNNITCLNGQHGFLVACNITYREEFLFHDSQMHRIVG